MGTPSEGLERLRVAAGSGELRALCQRWHVNLLTVFGSAGRGEPDPRDLDIGVLTEHGADVDLFEFVTDVIELVGLEEVDVVHLNAAGPLLRERALVGSIVLHERQLARAGVLEWDLAAALRPSAGRRNVLVHDYLEVDHGKVSAAIPLALDQYGQYVRHVARWLRSPSPESSDPSMDD